MKNVEIEVKAQTCFWRGPNARPRDSAEMACSLMFPSLFKASKKTGFMSGFTDLSSDSMAWLRNNERSN